MSVTKIKPTTVLVWLVWAIVVVGSVLYLTQLVGRNPARHTGLRLAGDSVWAILPLVFVTVGALIVSNQSRNVIGWLLSLPAFAMLLGFGITVLLSRMTQPPVDPPLWLVVAVYLSNAGWVLLIFPVFFIALLFPTGSPLSPRWSWVVYFGIGLVTFFLVVAMFAREFGLDPATYGLHWTIKNPIGFLSQASVDAIFFPWWPVGLASFAVLALASLFVRYRRAGVVERQQIKWLLYACGIFALFYLSMLPSGGDDGGLAGDVLNIVMPLTLMGFPIAIGIAILRYRVFDIDIIIRRTLTYGLVTGALILVFFGSVIILQQLFASLLGSAQNELVTVLSTLAIAGLFLPLRNRIQSTIDRRFNRRKYDAQKVLAQFAEMARDETDLEKLSGQLVQAVNETMQPSTVRVRLKEHAPRK